MRFWRFLGLCWDDSRGSSRKQERAERTGSGAPAEGGLDGEGERQDDGKPAGNHAEERLDGRMQADWLESLVREARGSGVR